MKVHVASPLRSYTAQRKEVDAAGATVRELLDDLDSQFPGIRFRMIDEQDAIRPHMRIFVNQDAAESIDTPVAPTDEVSIFQALSGG